MNLQVYYTLLYYTILYHTYLHYFILYYTILYYTIYYILHTTYYILHTTYYILHTTYYILYTIYYILYTIYYTILSYTIPCKLLRPPLYLPRTEPMILGALSAEKRQRPRHGRRPGRVDGLPPGAASILMLIGAPCSVQDGTRKCRQHSTIYKNEKKYSMI